ncbi:MAG: hypothetical protein AAB646_02250 [Patescibacteria group bacterium]
MKAEGNPPFVRGPGLCDQIKRARSHEEIDALLMKGTYFDDAKSVTRRRWARLANRRRQQVKSSID